MSASYTGNPANNPTSITLPSDGDLITAASVNTAFEPIIDKIEHDAQVGGQHPLRVGLVADMQAATAVDGDQFLVVAEVPPPGSAYTTNMYVWQSGADPTYAAAPQRYDGASTTLGVGAWVLVARPNETIATGYKEAAVTTIVTSTAGYDDILETSGPDVPLSLTFGNLIANDVIKVDAQCIVEGDRHGQFEIIYDAGAGDVFSAFGKFERTINPTSAIEKETIRWSLTIVLATTVTAITIRLGGVQDTSFGGSGDITVSAACIRAEVQRP